MTDPINDWGDMVMPGVYMIQRRNQKAVAAVEKANSELGINYEELYLEAEEIQAHIDKLLRSNEEIMEYLNDACNGEHADTSPDAEDDDQGMQMLTHPKVVEVSESDVEIFREALAENEGVIATKKRRLAEILTILATNKCGCQFHKHGENSISAPAPAAEPPAPADRFSL